MKRRAFIVPLAVIAALLAGGGGVLAWQWWHQGLDGERRPAFAMPDVSGEPRTISEWDGNIIVLNFWASWCAPCREEIPLFVKLQDRFAADGVRFVGVAVDRLAAVKAFIQDYAVDYPNLYGLQAAMDVQRLYGNQAGTLPYTVVIDRSGIIRHIFPRQIHQGQLAPVLQRLINKS